MFISNWTKLKSLLRDLTPPLLWRSLKQLTIPQKEMTRSYIEWEYIPEGWEVADRDPNIKGWNVEAILAAYQKNWSSFLRNLEGTFPLAISPEAASEERTSLSFHNTILTYAFVLALVSRWKNAITLLDWGGGMGHYYLISKHLIPTLEIDYSCKDVPLLAEYGQKLFPEAHFYTDETCLNQQYDLVLASGSFQYAQDWQVTLKQLATATAGYLFITRLPIVHQVPSFVMVQRPYQYGYETEYLGWCLNRIELLQQAETIGLEIIREFIIGEQPYILNAPEQCEYRGFLFQLKNKH